jgi:hypothetical protein
MHFVKETPPAALLECPPLPEPAHPNSQKDVAVYVVTLEAAGRACRQALDEVRAWAAVQP